MHQMIFAGFTDHLWNDYLTMNNKSASGLQEEAESMAEVIIERTGMMAVEDFQLFIII